MLAWPYVSRLASTPRRISTSEFNFFFQFAHLIPLIRCLKRFFVHNFLSHSTLNVNLKAVFNVTQTLLAHINDGGSIVNVSSIAGTHAFLDHSIYSASKAGVDALTRAFALELGPRKIRVNSVNPTVVLTAMSIPNWSDPVKAGGLKSRIPLRRFAELNEVADPIIYLLSNKSSFINGHLVPIEGGFSAC